MQLNRLAVEDRDAMLNHLAETSFDLLESRDGTFLVSARLTGDAPLPAGLVPGHAAPVGPSSSAARSYSASPEPRAGVSAETPASSARPIGWSYYRSPTAERSNASNARDQSTGKKKARGAAAAAGAAAPSSQTSSAAVPAAGGAPSSAASGPSVRPLRWLLAMIDEIYERRLAVYGVEVESAVSEFQSLSLFVYQHILDKFGLETLVAENSRDLIASVQHYSPSSSEVALFSSFLTGAYDAVDLLFYLYARHSTLLEAVDEQDEKIPDYLADAGFPTPKKMYKRKVLAGNIIVLLTRLILERQPVELAERVIERLNDLCEPQGPVTAKWVDAHIYLAEMVKVFHHHNLRIKALLLQAF